MREHYTFHAGASHGWLEVPIEDIEAAGVNLDDISGYSYVSNDTLFLEEDYDMPIFVLANKNNLNRDVVIKEISDYGDFVRNLTSIGEMRGAA